MDLKKQKLSIIFYTTPAHGHINPALPVIRCLSEKYHVIAYSTEEFQSVLENSGAVFYPYNLGDIRFDTSVGSKILPLTHLILQFTRQTLPELIQQAKETSPVLIIHDTLALWGRIVGSCLSVPTASLNTIQTIYSIPSNTFRLYCRHFALRTVFQLYALKDILKIRKYLRKHYIIDKSDFLSLLMNREKLNIFTYPRCMHPDGQTLKEDCFFLGTSARLRKNQTGYTMTEYHNLIYVSLGTIFNKNLSFYQRLIKEFGNTEYHILVSCGDNFDKLKKKNFPKNFTLAPYVNQSAVLIHAQLFITAGGMNSLCEAVAMGVPCLIVPQQGEQSANAVMAQRLKAGIISKGKFYRESKQLIDTFQKNDTLINTFSSVHLNTLMTVLENYQKGNTS